MQVATYTQVYMVYINLEGRNVYRFNLINSAFAGCAVYLYKLSNPFDSIIYQMEWVFEKGRFGYVKYMV